MNWDQERFARTQPKPFLVSLDTILVLLVAGILIALILFWPTVPY